MRVQVAAANEEFAKRIKRQPDDQLRASLNHYEIAVYFRRCDRRRS